MKQQYEELFENYAANYKKGDWKPLESYIREHSEAEFSHGICPECARKYYPELTE